MNYHEFPARWQRLKASAPQLTLDRVCEYFLAQVASAEGKKGGQFYTPSHVVGILVEMLAPYRASMTRSADRAACS